MQTVEPKFPMKFVCQPGPRANSAVGKGGLSAHCPLPASLFLWELASWKTALSVGS